MFIPTEEQKRILESNELFTKDYKTIFSTYLSKVAEDGNEHTLEEYVSAINAANPSYVPEAGNKSFTYSFDKHVFKLFSRDGKIIIYGEAPIFFSLSFKDKDPVQLGEAFTGLFETIRRKKVHNDLKYAVYLEEQRKYKISEDVKHRCWDLVRSRCEPDSPEDVIEQAHAEFMEIKKQGYRETYELECTPIDPEWEEDWKYILRDVMNKKKRQAAADAKKRIRQAEKDREKRDFEASMEEAVKIMPDIDQHRIRKVSVSRGDSYHDRYYFSIADRCCLEICDYSMLHPCEVAELMSASLPLMLSLSEISKTKPQLKFLDEARDEAYLERNTRFLKVCAPLNGQSEVFCVSLDPKASQEEIDAAMKIARDLSDIRVGRKFRIKFA